jgi:hypothetical protein
MCEAYDWLSNNGLIAVLPGESSGWGFVTRHGDRVSAAKDGRALLAAEARLNVDLHPLVERRVRRQFLLGE